MKKELTEVLIIALIALFISDTSSANSLCFGKSSNQYSFEQVSRTEITFHPAACESTSVVQIEPIVLQFTVPVDVTIFKVTIIHPYAEISNEYLASVFKNTMGVYTDNFGDHFLWVEPNTKVTIEIPVDAANFKFSPNLFSIEYEPYLYK